ncbi:hypothetical protein ACJMK2_030862, partial [Sinanodonta woodiana]
MEDSKSFIQVTVSKVHIDQQSSPSLSLDKEIVVKPSNSPLLDALPQSAQEIVVKPFNFSLPDPLQQSAQEILAKPSSFPLVVPLQQSTKIRRGKIIHG